MCLQSVGDDVALLGRNLAGIFGPEHVTGFTNGEEEAVQLTKIVPFLVEDELLRLGAIYEKVRN